MSQKRKHVTLTLDKKYEILKRLEKGEKLTHLSKEYNIGRATIHDIKTKKDKIESFFIRKNDKCVKERKTLKTGDFPQVENALYAWFLQERNRHTPISGEILMEKAKMFYNKIMNKDDFRASIGWLDKFKKRFGIRLLTCTGEKLSSDEEAARSFVNRFEEIVVEKGLGPDQIYNADESGLFYRLLPNKTFVHRAEASAPGRKLAKDRITFMPCCNASGSHKLELLVIGKSKNPRPFKNVQLPVSYINSTRGWMTQTLFSEWFRQTFVPSVKKFLKKNNLPQKAILLIDNCPGHPDEHELRTEDGNIVALFLPPNVTPLLQPMDQNVIQTIKMSYKKTLLYSVLSKEGSIVTALKEINLKDAVFNLANAWDKLTTKTIVCSWAKLWPSLDLLKDYEKNPKNAESYQDDQQIHNDTNVEINDLRDAIAEQLMDEPDELTTADVKTWLEGTDEEDFPSMTDNEIMEYVMEGDDDDDTGGEGGASTSTATATPIHTVNMDTALSAFATAITWAEENGASSSELLTLRRLQENVLKLAFNVKKQKSITHFFDTV